jgi:hypothetical protein
VDSGRSVLIGELSDARSALAEVVLMIKVESTFEGRRA